MPDMPIATHLAGDPWGALMAVLVLGAATEALGALLKTWNVHLLPRVRRTYRVHLHLKAVLGPDGHPVNGAKERRRALAAASASNALAIGVALAALGRIDALGAAFGAGGEDAGPIAYWARVVASGAAAAVLGGIWHELLRVLGAGRRGREEHPPEPELPWKSASMSSGSDPVRPDEPSPTAPGVDSASANKGSA